MADKPAAKATKVDLNSLVNDSTGTQIRDAFKACGIELDEFCPPGASNPGVYNGVQIVDAFKAYDKAHPKIIDMNTISVGMKGTQVVDAFKKMNAETVKLAAAAAKGTGSSGGGGAQPGATST